MTDRSQEIAFNAGVQANHARLPIQFADNQHEVGALGVRSERSAVQGAQNFRRSCVSYHILRAAIEQKIARELGKPVWEEAMALIPIDCPNESCEHLGFVSVETLPRVLTCSSCGLQSLHVAPPVSAKKNCKFAVSEWREREQYPSQPA